MKRRRATGEGTKGRGEGQQQQGADSSGADDLFKLPLAEFTAARNEMAATLKKSGDAEKAEQIRTLGKPTLSAWVANQLYWRHRDAFERLLTAGDGFRNAQAAQLAGKSADIRAPLEARREALGELAKQASTVLRESGHPAAPDTMRRITTTLEAVATYGHSPGAPTPGRLTADVDPPGFEALAALVPRAAGSLRGTAPTRVIPFTPPKSTAHPSKKTGKDDEQQRAAQRRAHEAELRKALHEAEHALKDAQRDADKARDQMKDAAGRAKESEKTRAALEQQLEKAVAAAESARQDARRVAGQAEDAAQALADAERAVDRAREALTDI